MDRNVSLVLTIVRDAKLPGVLDLSDEFAGWRFTWGPTGSVGLVQLDVKNLDAQVQAFDWIAHHPDIKVVDQVYAPGSDGVTEYVVVRIVDGRAARARRNARDLDAKINNRRVAAQNDLGGGTPAAIVVDIYVGKLVQWETERDCWQRIASHPAEFRNIFSSAVVDLITGLGNSADALEDALRVRKLEGLRSFVRRARVYMDPEDAVDALLSF